MLLLYRGILLLDRASAAALADAQGAMQGGARRKEHLNRRRNGPLRVGPYSQRLP